ncbi:MAG: sigma-70 family RNA polymerase sigma factor [Cyanobacteria bacterium REEB417]|nr:sigma-70 family RNA polymerase sigma factor [Cyanobacteria bacterium REEB417]
MSLQPIDQWYLNNCGREPLLTAREELILSRQIQQGRAPEATPRQQRIGERARQRMIRGNQRLAVNVAMKYLRRCRSLELSDLVQEALLGLSTAVEKFDYTKGYKFSTYAYWWIRQSINRAIVSRDTIIRVPQHTHDDYARVKHLMAQSAAHGEAMTLKQAAAIVGVKLETLELAIRAESVTTLNRPAATATGSETELIDLMPGEPEEEPNGLPLLSAEVRSYVSTHWLSEQEVDVITERFGLNDGEPKTLASIAKKRGVSRERIRQVEGKALRRLRYCLAQQLTPIAAAS